MSHHLHRIYARHAATVWELEARWMREQGTFRAPAAVQWMATRSCDLTCGHCYSRAGHRHPAELTTTEARALIDELVAMRCPDLVIAGGEPLLRHDLAEIVAYAVASGLRWSIHTHGGLVERHRDLFEAHPPALAAVSVDGPPRLHDAVRGKAGSYEGAMRAVAVLRDIADRNDDARVVIGTTVTARNADHLPDMIDDVIASGADAWGLHLFAPEGRGAEHAELLPSPTQLQRVAALARRWRRTMDVDLDNEWGSAGDRDPFYRDQPYLCGAGRFTCVVAVDGAIVPCTTTDPAEAEGNVRTERLRDVWQHGFSRFRGPGDATCSDGADCWLQTRNGHSCRTHAFGAVSPALPIPEVPAPRPRRAGLHALAVAAVAATLSAPAHAGDTDFPAEFDLEQWSAHRVEHGWHAPTPWTTLKRARLARTGADVPSLPKTSAVLTTDQKLPATRLLAALAEAEAQQVWDPWLVQQLWVRSGPGSTEELAALYARLERHARTVDALILAMAETGPVTFLPWRRKSAPPADYKAVRVPEGLLDAARARFATLDAGTWRSEATVTLTLGGTATLHRQGTATPVQGTVRLGRLDVIELASPATVQLGSATVTLARTWGPTTAWTLPARLSASDEATVRALVHAARDGSASAIDDLSRALPVVHAAIRIALAETPDAEGAPALRSLLTLFDE